MSLFFLICAALSIVLTVFALGAGLISMVKPSAFREEHANKLMKLRVISQGMALAFLFLAFTVFKS